MCDRSTSQNHWGILVERFTFDGIFDELEAQMKDYSKSKGSWGGRLSPPTSGTRADGEIRFGAIGKGTRFSQPS
jgi:hypothetical protein